MGKDLSDLQSAILGILRTVPDVDERSDAWGHVYVGHLPTTGDIIDALGRPRDPAGYASVSRALARLESRGLVVGWSTVIALPGRGRRWAPHRSEGGAA